jgi:hypothetical protein
VYFTAGFRLRSPSFDPTGRSSRKARREKIIFFLFTLQLTTSFLREMLKAHTSGIIDFQEFWFNVFMTNFTLAYFFES